MTGYVDILAHEAVAAHREWQRRFDAAYEAGARTNDNPGIRDAARYEAASRALLQLLDNEIDANEMRNR